MGGENGNRKGSQENKNKKGENVRKPKGDNPKGNGDTKGGNKKGQENGKSKPSGGDGSGDQAGAAGGKPNTPGNNGANKGNTRIQKMCDVYNRHKHDNGPACIDTRGPDGKCKFEHIDLSLKDHRAREAQIKEWMERQKAKKAAEPADGIAEKGGKGRGKGGKKGS